MKLIDMEQGTDTWKLWRASKITGTDCATILGENPFEDKITLWKRKLGLIPEKELTEVMKRGSELEGCARIIANAETTFNYQPAVVESSVTPWAAASLDGYHPQSNSILEIKCGKSAHKSALLDTVPFYYQLQMQWQMYCSSTDYCHYYTYDPKHETPFTSRIVERNQSMMNWMIPQCLEFWNCLNEFREPQ